MEKAHPMKGAPHVLTLGFALGESLCPKFARRFVECLCFVCGLCTNESEQSLRHCRISERVLRDLVFHRWERLRVNERVATFARATYSKSRPKFPKTHWPDKALARVRA